MAKEHSFVHALHVFLKTGLFTVMVVGLACCELHPGGIGSSNPRLEQMIADIGDKMESNNRKLTNLLDTQRGATDSNFEKTLNLIEDMNKQLKQQQQDLEKIKAMVESGPTKPPYQAPTPTPTPMPMPGTGAGAATTPSNFVQALNAGRQLYDQNNFPGAREMLQNALALAKAETDPAVSKREQIAANYWMGEAAFALKDNTAAKASYWAAINLDNTGIDAWQSFERLADIARAEGDNATALKNYQTILSQFQAKNSKYPGEDRVKAKIAEIQGAGAPTAPPAGGLAPAPIPAMGPQGSFMQPGFNGQ